MITMNKSDSKRAVMVDRIADFILREGLAAASLRPMAEAAGTSDRMLLYYFTDKAAVVSAALEVLSARLVAVLNDRRADAPLPAEALRARLVEMAAAPDVWPYLCLWLEIVANAARGDPFHRAVGEGLGRGYLKWIAAQLDAPDPNTRAELASEVFTYVEGSILLQAVGLRDATPSV